MAMFILNSNGRKCKRSLGLSITSKLENVEDVVGANKIVTICLLVLLFQSLEALLVQELFMFGHIDYRYVLCSGNMLHKTKVPILHSITFGLTPYNWIHYQFNLCK